MNDELKKIKIWKNLNFVYQQLFLLIIFIHVYSFYKVAFVPVLLIAVYFNLCRIFWNRKSVPEKRLSKLSHLTVIYPYFFYDFFCLIGLTTSLLVYAIFFFIPIVIYPKLEISTATYNYLFLITVTFSALLSFYSIFIRTIKIKITKKNISLHKIQSNIKQIKIVHISDLHLGNITTEKFIERVVLKVNKLNPNLILITGDFITYGSNFLDNLFITLKKLKAQNHIIASLGNHDYFTELSDLKNGLKKTGIKLLINENIIVDIEGQPFSIGGLDGAVDNLLIHDKNLGTIKKK